MLIFPSLSLFYVDILNLSHLQITMARFVFMALGVMSSSFFWKKGLQKVHLNVLSIWILVGFGVFDLCMIIATKSLFFSLYRLCFLWDCAIWKPSSLEFVKDPFLQKVTHLYVTQVLTYS